MRDNYDYLVIGSGPAGHTSAIIAAQAGLRTALVEKDPAMLGGVCLNEGCIPAKSLYNSAKILGIAKNNPDIFGVAIPSGSDCMGSFVGKSIKTVGQLKQGLSFLLKKNDIDFIKAKAEFLDPGTIKLTAPEGGERIVKAGKFLIASGSRARQLKEIPFDGRKVISSADAIRLEKIPGKILIVGSGAIGTEFASFFNTMGSEVTLVEIEPAILPTEDKDVSIGLRSIFTKRGIKVLTSSGPSDFKVEDFDMVLVSVGRAPSTSGLGLERAGVKTDEKGFIPVDGSMCTNVDNIYAAGDVLSTPMLAHMASAEGEAAAMSVLGKDPGTIDLSAVPNAVYSDIQAASVGLTEQAAGEKGIDFSIGKQFFKANGKALVNSQAEGFIKVLAENGTRRIIGAHILGVNATEIIHEFALAKRKHLTVDDIYGTVHAHPTFSESAIDAAKSVFGKPVHG